MRLSTLLLEEAGRTTMRSAPMVWTWVEIRRLMLPIKERIRIIAATPIEIPRQVRKLRVRFFAIES